jgi:uncharacterized YccA/Bax inhibitor family protein
MLRRFPPCLGSIDNKYKKTFALFDTGASMTAVSRDIIASLDHVIVAGENTTVTGFGGKKTADYAILADLVIGGFHLGPVTTLVAEFSDDTRYDVILGMNIISSFNIDITFTSDSSTDGCITLHPRFDVSALRLQTAGNYDFRNSRFGIWSMAPNHLPEKS